MVYPLFLQHWWNSDIFSLLNFENPLSSSKVIRVFVINWTIIGQKGQFLPLFCLTVQLQMALISLGRHMCAYFLFVLCTRDHKVLHGQKKSGVQRGAHNFLTPNRKYKNYYFDLNKNIWSALLKMTSIMHFSISEHFFCSKTIYYKHVQWVKSYMVV